MRHSLYSCALLLTLVNCNMLQDVEIVPLHAQSVDGGKTCPDIPDMAAAPPRCAAAKGLAGDNLLCVDFKDVQMPASLAGWDFSLCTAGWTTTGGKLQVNNFATFMDTCTFKVPPLSAADYAKYNSFTLSVVHRVSLDETASQKVQVMQGADDPINRLLTQWAGKQARQQSIVTIGKTDLPGTGPFQPLFKLSATNTAGGSFSGWQIESIAINGVQ